MTAQERARKVMTQWWGKQPILPSVRIRRLEQLFAKEIESAEADKQKEIDRLKGEKSFHKTKA